MRSLTFIFLAVTMRSFTPAEGQSTLPEDARLEVVAAFGQSQPIGVSVSSDNRIFVSFPKRDPYEMGLAEVKDGKRTAYPDLQWNRKEGDENETFVNVQDIYVDGNDHLWVLDSKPAPQNSVFGNDGSGEKKNGQFKLLQIDLHTDSVLHVFNFDDLDKSKSGLNDVRVDTDKKLAYLSDPGQAAVVILDLISGESRVVLQHHFSTLADSGIVLRYEGKKMEDKSGNMFRSNVNGIALTKDLRYFYYRPINGLHLYRIETKYLADNTLSEQQLASYVEDMGETAVCHGMEADAAGNIYITSSLDYSIKYFTPAGKLITLVQDPRLIWPDSLGIGTDGYLYFSCAQVNRLPQWNGGVDKTSFPYRIYRVKLPPTS
ncbi:L-dopachrome tautomerase-related protein [Sphingobacterium spiritivorum]|uniref:L-dopachrome tautomerase-related protein n=2 Tax=Sphingobacterium spiritivorum TaxID=258 RepID=UPI003DA22856